MQLVDNNCVLYPRELEFHMVDLQDIPEYSSTNLTQAFTTPEDVTKQSAQNSSVPMNNVSDEEKIIRELINATTSSNNNDSAPIENVVNILTSKFTYNFYFFT